MTAVESTELGGAIGRIRAEDPDSGRNAEMEYTIVGGHDVFNIITDQTTQEGVIIIKKVKKKKKEVSLVTRTDCGHVTDHVTTLDLLTTYTMEFEQTLCGY